MTLSEPADPRHRDTRADRIHWHVAKGGNGIAYQQGWQAYLNGHPQDAAARIAPHHQASFQAGYRTAREHGEKMLQAPS